MRNVKITQLNAAMRKLNISLRIAMEKFDNDIKKAFNPLEDPDNDKVVTFSLSIHDIFKEVESISGLPVFTERNKKGDNVMYRQIAYYILNTMGYGPSEIASHSNRDHATIIHGRKMVEDLLEVGDVKYTYNYNKVVEHLRTVHQEKVANENEKKYGKASIANCN